MAAGHTEDGTSGRSTANSKQLKDGLVSKIGKLSGLISLERQRWEATLTNTSAHDAPALAARACVRGGGDSTDEERDGGVDTGGAG